MEAVLGIDGSFALIAQDGERIVLARGVAARDRARPLRQRGLEDVLAARRLDVASARQRHVVEPLAPAEDAGHLVG